MKQVNLGDSFKLMTKKLRASILFTAIALTIATLATTSAGAQNSWPVGSRWHEISQAVYNGGQERVIFRFPFEVEAIHFAVVVPQYCAPRALASRAQIIPEFGHPGYTRWVDLRFRSQETWGGQIRAFYSVDDRLLTSTPLVTALVFSFAPIPNRPATACPLRVFTRG